MFSWAEENEINNLMTTSSRSLITFLRLVVVNVGINYETFNDQLAKLNEFQFNRNLQVVTTVKKVRRHLRILSNRNIFKEDVVTRCVWFTL